MGQIQSMCGQNILDKLLKQYGGDAMKFITAQKSKLLLNDKFAQVSRKFHQAFQQFQTSILALAQGKTSDFTKAFQGLKNKANSVLPGGIASLQRIKGQSINEFSGFNKVLKQIQQVKNKTSQNLSLQKTQMMKKLQSQKQELADNIQKQKPKIPLYDQIPQPLRNQLFKEAQKNFSKQLASNEQDLDKNIMGLFNASEINRMFQKMSPASIFENILGNGLGTLQKNIFSSIGGGIGNIGGGINNGAIGGFFNNFKRNHLILYLIFILRVFLRYIYFYLNHISLNYDIFCFLKISISFRSMFRLLPLASRMMPKLFKTAILCYSLYYMVPKSSSLFKKVNCFTFKGQDEVDPINNLLSQVVKVCIDGDTMGYAFCIEQNILATASPYLVQKRRQKEKLQFYIRDFNIRAQYEILGHFENLTFIRILSSNKKLVPMPSIKPTQRIPITHVQVIQKRSYLSIKDGYIVSKASGFGIVDGKGQVGSLVIANGTAAGVVTSIGRDSERGFMRMVAWGDLLNVYKRIEKLKNDQLYLGLSAAALEQRDGLAIARITPMSPFSGKVFMGDIILKVNNQAIKQTQDLKRIIMFSSNEITVQVQRQGKTVDVVISEL